jgi:predicted lipoprotein with Yx(FWY)xxD motif
LRRTRHAGLFRTTPLLALSILVAVVSTSCGSGQKSPPRYSGPAYGVGAGSVSGLGTVLVDGQGFTLYMYEPDAQSGKSKCYGPCAVEWSPVTLPTGVTRPVAGPGITASKLSTTKRTDGSVQVTYNRWPLYTWAQDMAPGQATGEGLDNLGGLWYVLSPTGTPIEKRTSGSV